MTVRKMFRLEELRNELSLIDRLLESPAKVFLIGGCAMAFMGAKIATKDIDIILLSRKDVDLIRGALEAGGFKFIQFMEQDSDDLSGPMVFRNAKEMQFDIFLRTVCRKVEISDRMIGRSKRLEIFDRLEVRLISPEDIFLFKGITERESDLDDMAVLAERGLDWRVIEEECSLQRKRQIWELFLFAKLDELEKSHGIVSPIKADLLKAGGEQLIERMFLSIIGTKQMSFKKISDAVLTKYQYSSSWTRKQLKHLVNKKIINATRLGSKMLYSIP